MKQPEHQENNPERPPALADATGSARFIISRTKYPEYYTGTNEFGYPGWVSNRDKAMQVREHKLVERMMSIVGHGEISATLVSPNAKSSHAAGDGLG